jgi:hypothetical protein
MFSLSDVVSYTLTAPYARRRKAMALTQINAQDTGITPVSVDDLTPWLKAQWQYLARWLPRHLDQLAREHRAAAFQSHGRIEDASTLLHLVCLWAVGSFSFQVCAAFAHAAGLVSMSGVALHKRFSRMTGLLEATICALVPRGQDARSLKLRQKWTVLVADGTDLFAPNQHSKLLWGLNLADLSIDQVLFDPRRPRMGETFRHFVVRAGQLWLGDRIYASGVGLAYLRERGAHALVRYHRKLTLYKTAACEQRLDPLELARTSRHGETRAYNVWIRVGQERFEVRLIAKKLTESAHQRQIQQLEYSKVQKRPYTIEIAGYLLLVTTVPAEEMSTTEALALYRLRWQIELRIKRAKSLMGLTEMRSRKPEMISVWILAHIMAQLLVDKLEAEALDEHGQARREQAFRLDQMSWQLMQSSLFSIPLQHLNSFLTKFCQALPQRQAKRKQRSYHRLQQAFAPQKGPLWQSAVGMCETG